MHAVSCLHVVICGVPESDESTLINQECSLPYCCSIDCISGDLLVNERFSLFTLLCNIMEVL